VPPRASGRHTGKKKAPVHRRGYGCINIIFNHYQAILDPQVCFLDVLIIEQFLAASLEDDAAVFQHIGPVAQI
jgi:hypothetical protein